MKDALKSLKPGLNGQVLKLKLKLDNPWDQLGTVFKITGPAVEVETIDENGEPEYGWEYPVEPVNTYLTNEKLK